MFASFDTVDCFDVPGELNCVNEEFDGLNIFDSSHFAVFSFLNTPQFSFLQSSQSSFNVLEWKAVDWGPVLLLWLVLFCFYINKVVIEAVWTGTLDKQTQNLYAVIDT